MLIKSYYPFIEFQEGALELLCHHDWPGNVRELRFMVERLVAKADGRMITTGHVRREINAVE
jgi:sigma-54 dependent transcriptional regulator, acetoin dehydrogenase operon transcriptional activator AcoR